VALLFERGVQAIVFADCEAADSEDSKSPAGRESGVYTVQEEAMMRELIQELNQISPRGSLNHSVVRPRLEIYPLPSVLLTTSHGAEGVKASGLAALAISVSLRAPGLNPTELYEIPTNEIEL
jgi:hypothetical protein